MLKAFLRVASNFKKSAKALVAFAVVAGCSTAPVVTPAEAAPEKYAAIVVDANTGKTLFASNADAKRYPASLTKMMTLYMMFEAMKTGKMNRNTPIKVSAYAAARPPTKIGFKAGQSIPAEAAILALITRSANDVASAVGEHLGGSEGRFAQMMTARARQLGMRSTTFRNASGLPNKEQHTTARDMAVLGMALRQHFPKEFAYFSQKSFVYRGQTINGHNRLLGRIQGVDGIKTGYTNASGFNLVSSVSADGRQIVAVVMGGRTAASRDAHMSELIKKHLPLAKRGRVSSSALIAANSSGPIEVAALELPVAHRAPIPASRVNITPVAAPSSNVPAATIPSANVPTPAHNQGSGSQIEDIINRAFGGEEAQQPRMLALAAPSARPAAAALEAVMAPTPRQSLESDQTAGVDPVTTSSANISGGWAIQIGSLPTANQATEMLSKAASASGRLLANATPHTETFQKNGTVFYRARFTGFNSKDAAWKACNALKKQKFGCYAIAN